MPSDPGGPASTYPRQRLSLEAELEEVLRTCGGDASSRDLLVIEEYWGLRCGRPKTLDAIGTGLRLSRERVRQLRNRTQSTIRAALLGREPLSVIFMREIVQANRGLRGLEGLVSDLQRLVLPGAYNCAAYVRFILSLEATPELRHLPPGIVVNQLIGSSTVERAVSAMRAALQLKRATLFEELVAVASGVLPTTDYEILEEHVRSLVPSVGREVLPGIYSLRTWNRAAYCEFILEHEGEALHFSEIARRVCVLTGKEFHAAGFNTVLNSDPVFVRVGAGDFALARWGARRYGRFDEVIERYLSAGRIAEHVDRMTADLLGQYTVAESTLRAMLSMARGKFVNYGGGYWGLASYRPVVDENLAALVATILRDHGRPVPVMDVARKVSELWSTPLQYALDEAERVLYVSPAFRWIGGPSNRKFVLSESIQ